VGEQEKTSDLASRRQKIPCNKNARSTKHTYISIWTLAVLRNVKLFQRLKINHESVYDRRKKYLFNLKDKSKGKSFHVLNQLSITP
jgi:hypothetical protein